jgi:hypothetical protein
MLWLSYEKKKCEKNNLFYILKVIEERSRIRNWIQNVMDLQHWILHRLQTSLYICHGRITIAILSFGIMWHEGVSTQPQSTF